MFVEVYFVSLYDAVDKEEHDGSRHHHEGVEEAEGGGEAVLGFSVQEGRGRTDQEGQDGVQDGEETVDLAQLLLGHQVGQQRPVDNVAHPSLHTDGPS